ncbi:uncharacterized protein N7496_003825 [Penicillium cataractarum]|uniref:CASTOR ACT domain-containing protein n=1 Tax=Penicillium cataractarum TaxID=2100454 RepID=A0A9W9SMW3_9EURO|nr:uncharacterized protein N7496_003825 [Penicillium cataractarum]KAJ5381397.1 hypothetical protein N7496_003825 [Penicillium cataractarum]
MDQSMTMIDAQVQFLEEQLVLVHIPLELYPYFFKPVLRLIFDEIAPLQDSNQDEEDVLDDSESISDAGAEYREPAFLNVSITPVEVSVICPRRLVEKYFDPLINQLSQIDASLRSRVDVSDNDYIAMQVLGQGLEAGKRVLELTSPLAMAGISIFFITTYFSDYILVPLRSKSSVISTLESRGFQFENANTAFTNPLSPPVERKLSDAVGPPVTPPPSTVAELQTRTFENLRKRQISPTVDTTLRLVQCAAHHPYHRQESSMSILRDALAKVLLVDEPRFLSLTLAALDPAASLLLEKRLLPRFSRKTDDDDGSSLLLGAQGDYLVPIMLDLRDLPLEASGIVCGVAGRLAEATSHSSRDAHADTNSQVSSQQSSVIGSVPKLFDTFGTQLALNDKKPSSQHQLAPVTHHLKPDLDSSADAVEISFLSTARAGTIIVGEDELQRAIDALDAEKVQDSPADVVSDTTEVGLGLETETVDVEQTED